MLLGLSVSGTAVDKRELPQQSRQNPPNRKPQLPRVDLNRMKSHESKNMHHPMRKSKPPLPLHESRGIRSNVKETTNRFSSTQARQWSNNGHFSCGVGYSKAYQERSRRTINAYGGHISARSFEGLPWKSGVSQRPLTSPAARQERAARSTGHLSDQRGKNGGNRRTVGSATRTVPSGGIAVSGHRVETQKARGGLQSGGQTNTSRARRVRGRDRSVDSRESLASAVSVESLRRFRSAAGVYQPASPAVSVVGRERTRLTRGSVRASKTACVSSTPIRVHTASSEAAWCTPRVRLSGRGETRGALTSRRRNPPRQLPSPKERPGWRF